MARLARVLARLVTLLVACGIVAGVMTLAPARGAVAAGWEPTGLSTRALGLDAPTSGALFAWTEANVQRNDDGGASWRPVPLPTALAGNPAAYRTLAIDPSDHTHMLTGGWVTHDDGATWVQPGSWPAKDGDTVRLLVSPADPNVLYLSLTRGSMGVGSVEMLRSGDGGGTWAPFLSLRPGNFLPSAFVDVTLFETHPSNPDVVFETVVGFRGSGNQGILRRSDDQGKTFKETLFNASRYPILLAGGRGANPGRFYCALGSSDASRELYRSDDDGVTWTKIASYDEPGEGVTSMAADPAMPDRVYVAMRSGSVLRSDDAGQTWADLGLTEQTVNDLALGVDRKNLYAATDQGVLKLPLA